MPKLRQELLEDAIDGLADTVHGLIRNGAPISIHVTFGAFQRKWTAYKQSEPDPDSPPEDEPAWAGLVGPGPTKT